jgi:hypothetical protein
MSDPIELEVTEILHNMGIAKIHRTIDSSDNPILIIIPKDTTNYKTLQFEIGTDPEASAYNCESACRDYLDHKIISALQIFVTDNWDKIKPEYEKEGKQDDNNANSDKKNKLNITYRPRYTDEEKNLLAEAILINKEAYWIISDNGDITVSKNPIKLNDKNRIEPLTEEQYLTKPYRFTSEAEVQDYVKKATSLRLDDIYHMIKKVVRKYLDADDYHTSIVTLSIIFTYYQDRVGTTHYLFFVGPPNCGKTNNLTLFEEMAYRCMASSGLSAANIYTFLGSWEEAMGTIAEDEADDIDETHDKMKVYKNGSRKGKPYHKIDLSSGRVQGRFFTFCFKAAAAERLPDPEKAGGLMQRIMTINCKSGSPKYDISEVTNPMGDSELEELHRELDHVHKLLLIYRMMHFHKKISDIYINLKNREKQLFKPLLRIFQGTRIQSTLVDILTEFVNKKRRENVDSLLAFTYDSVKRLIDEQKARGKNQLDTGAEKTKTAILFRGLWSLMTNETINPGKPATGKPNSYDSEQFGLFTQKEVASKVKVLGGELPKKRGQDRYYEFSEDTMDRLSRLYGEAREVTISLERPTASSSKSDDNDDLYDLYDSEGRQGKEQSK